MKINCLAYVPQGKTRQRDFVLKPLGKDHSLKEARKIAFSMIMRGETAFIRPSEKKPLQDAVYLQHMNKSGVMDPIGVVFALHWPWIYYQAYDPITGVPKGPIYEVHKDGSATRTDSIHRN